MTDGHYLAEQVQLPRNNPKPELPNEEPRKSKNIFYIPCPKCSQNEKPVPCGYCGSKGFVEILRDF
jgi:DNA-directed RNA polymerase subunit RPC12/RpoP